MSTDYDATSCNALEKPFYRPVEAALRWCNLVHHEGVILQQLDADLIPKTGQFPNWPCLQANTERLLDAIEHGELPHGRDGKTVNTGVQVARARLTIRHSDLREWMLKHNPGKKPAFLFDEFERTTHAAINTDSFLALQADRDATRAELVVARKWADDIQTELNAARSERDMLKLKVEQVPVPGDRAETTYYNIIGALVELIMSPRSGRDTEAAVIKELLKNYVDKPGISKPTLEKKFAEAKRRLKSS